MLFLSLLFIGFSLSFLALFLNRPSQEERQMKELEMYTLEGVIDYVKQTLKSRCHQGDSKTTFQFGSPGGAVDQIEFSKRIQRQRAELTHALRRCAQGSIKDKSYVLDVIAEILKSGERDLEKLLKIIPYDSPHRLSAMDKFDALLHRFQSIHGMNAFHELVKGYNLDQAQRGYDGEMGYRITDENIHAIYQAENMILTRDEQIKILAQRIYQHYKGFSCIDHLRDMAIDGISGGVSGCTELMGNFDVTQEHLKKLPMHYDSIWVFFQGKSLHLSFMSFGSEQELKRVCQNIYRYNNVGMLSQDVGYKINDMMDGSRVVVVRPSFSESWAFFVRKFHLEHVTLEALITDSNAQLPINLMRYLVKGGRITAITGSQGCGKTTLLMALVKEIYHPLTLRVQETAFELHLRRLYPYRNILTFKETHAISGQQGLDLQKKTDGSVNILGEVATDEVAAWMIQMAQVASLFTLFTHHAKTVSDLVLALRNSLLKCDVFRNELVAEEQVVSVVHYDIHLTRDYSGKRYIERITEIQPLTDKFEYPQAPSDSAKPADIGALYDLLRTYFERTTDRKTYIARDIVIYENGCYRWCFPISDAQKSAMISRMTTEDQVSFSKFLGDNWNWKEEMNNVKATSDCYSA